MKITKVIEHKDGSATMELEMNKIERDFMMELGVNEMIRIRMELFEKNLTKKGKRKVEETTFGVVPHEPPKPKKRGGVKK